MKLVVALLAFFSISVSSAVELSGVFKQGGFIVGKTDPEAQVFLNNTQTTVAKDGSFAIGIPRDSKKNSVLTVRLMDAIEEKHPVQIKQRAYKKQAIKGVLGKHVNPHAEHMSQIKGDSKQIKDARAVYQPLSFIKNTFQKPVKGGYRISGVYGSQRTYNGEERNWHKGVDFAAPTGTPVYAPAGGIVRLALKESFFNGNLIILDHGHQMMTIYAHLNSMDVKAGDTVKAGDLLGKVGSTGRSTGPHLHWGLYWRNMALDPMLLLKE